MASTIARQSVELNLEMDKGSDFSHKLTWKSGEVGQETPIDLTGATARMQLRSKASSGTFLHEMTTENGGIILGNATGEIYLYISSTDTSSFTFTKAVYDLEIELASGQVRRLIRGTITAYDEVTR